MQFPLEARGVEKILERRFPAGTTCHENRLSNLHENGRWMMLGRGQAQETELKPFTTNNLLVVAISSK